MTRDEFISRMIRVSGRVRDDGDRPVFYWMEKLEQEIVRDPCDGAGPFPEVPASPRRSFERDGLAGLSDADQVARQEQAEVCCMTEYRLAQDVAVDALTDLIQAHSDTTMTDYERPILLGPIDVARGELRKAGIDPDGVEKHGSRLVAALLRERQAREDFLHVAHRRDALVRERDTLALQNLHLLEALAFATIRNNQQA